MADVNAQYTPSLEEVREDYAEEGFNAPLRRAQFDRWLAAHEAAIRAEERKRLAEKTRPADPEVREAMRRLIAEGSYLRFQEDLPYADVADRLLEHFDIRAKD